MKWVIIIAIATIALGAAVYLIGLALPADHVATVNRIVSMPIDKTAARIRDVEGYGSWRKGIVVEDIFRDGAMVRYTEANNGNRISYEIIEPTPGQEFVSTITDDTLPFGGNWRILLKPERDGTNVTITETGVVRNPVFRFMSKFIFGYTATMNTYLDALAASAKN